jgi:predicted Ser/Thr protein kinase
MRQLVRQAARFALPLLATLAVTNFVSARTWTSKDGLYTLEADEVAFSETTVVLKRPTGKLVAVELAQLSDEDNKYIKSQAVKDAAEKSASELQTWTGADGLKVRGRVVAYGRKELKVQRKLGKVNIDDKKFSDIDQLHQLLLLKILSHLEESKFENEAQLEEWAKGLGGTPKVYMLDGVMMELESGDRIGVPFFMFSAEDQEVLKPGWELWLERKESEKAQEEESFLMRSAAMAYQRDRAVNQQIEMLKLDMLAAAAGVIDIWQVGLVPAPGVVGRPMTVMVPAQNSQLAAGLAMQQYRGYQVLGVRRASR